MGFRIKLKEPERVFGAYGKMRLEDFLTLSDSQKLTPRERKKMGNIADQMGKGTIENRDWFYTRKKTVVIFR